ncbi:hypothetical protein CGRA01v4_06535 [Colletotrichum graminicola]|nr:hypothetical protein CGRA01v4_06535 [Colletotrichum graminicola]
MALASRVDGQAVQAKKDRRLAVGDSKKGKLAKTHDFGQFEETMILSLSGDKIKLLDEIKAKRIPTKVRTTTAPTTRTTSKNKRPSMAGGGSAQQESKNEKKRKTKLTPSFSRRMRGRKTEEGMIHDTPGAAHLDFFNEMAYDL